MYVGRIVAVGRTKSGNNALMYRVSSRSFPNRKAVLNGSSAAVVPRDGFESDIQRNPYIAYNALKIVGSWAVASNGSHTDPICEHLAIGIPPRQALVSCLSIMDFEKDDLNTPRIAAIVSIEGQAAWLGIVRHDALIVKQTLLSDGEGMFLATYEADDIREGQRFDFDVNSSEELARFAIDGGVFADLDKPVTSAVALSTGGEFTLAVQVVDQPA